MKKIIYILFIFNFLSCNPEVIENPLIHENEMANILYDLHITDAYISQLKLNSNNTLDTLSYYKQMVFKKHNTNGTSFNQSLEYYAMFPEKIEKIYENVKKQIQELDLTIPNVDDNNNVTFDSIKTRNNFNDPLQTFSKKKNL